MEPEILRALADPIRRAVFERLAAGELSVGAPKNGFDVSQPATSQHLTYLRKAGLVSERREGRNTYYAADPAASIRCWAGSSATTFWPEKIERLKTVLKGIGPMSDARNEPPRDRSIAFERESPEAPEKVWRALTTPEIVSERPPPTDLQPEIGRNSASVILQQKTRRSNARFLMSSHRADLLFLAGRRGAATGSFHGHLRDRANRDGRHTFDIGTRFTMRRRSRSARRRRRSTTMAPCRCGSPPEPS